MKGNRISFPLKIFFLIVVPLLNFSNPQDKTIDIIHLGSEYIELWKNFYPSSAFAMGHRKSAFRYEEFSESAINKWLRFNKGILLKIRKENKNFGFHDRVDIRLLKRQVESEIEKWEHDKSYQNNSLLYSSMIAQALTYVLVSKKLSSQEKVTAIINRLRGIKKLSLFAIKNLRRGRPAQTAFCLSQLQSAVAFYENKLPQVVEAWEKPDKMRVFKGLCRDTAQSIKSLIAHIKDRVWPLVSIYPDSLGETHYSRKLKLYTGLKLTPEDLENLAFGEILWVRKKMDEVASEYLRESYPELPQPEDFAELMSKVIKDMEADHEKSQKDFLRLFVNLTNRAEAFVREKKLAKLPGSRTLFIDLSPAHFSGAAVGGVYSTGPFDPQADTLFYLPTVPDTAPETVKEGFYRSFNNHFNTIIIPHEMFPGHYLHLKIAASNPRLIRSLFGCSLYAEGWATLCEQIALDAGWNDFNKLTCLAHLRKRLENAVRAYGSVQVHCRGWKKEKLQDFAVNTGLLAPQFAVNLWHRVIESPFQLTSYFLGFRAFSEVYNREREKRGDSFSIYHFSNKILQAGSMPVDELMVLFE